MRSAKKPCKRCYRVECDCPRISTASSWQSWYKSKDWLSRRAATLAENPVCVRCQKRWATVADHIIPHRGDWLSFHFGDLQALCSSCHSIKTQQENSGDNST